MNTTSATVLKMRELKEGLNKTIFVVDYHTHEKVEMTVIEAFRDEYDIGASEVKKLIRDTFGEKNQYVFWMMFEELCCPAGTETACDMLKPLFDLEVY